MDENHKLIGSFCAELYAVETFEAHFKVYEKYVELLGFDGACYTFLPKIQVANIPLVQPVFASTENYPMAFLVDYEKKQFHNHDFTIRKGKENCSYDPMDWRDHELNGDLSEEEKSLIIFARVKHGIINAFTIPTQVSDVILAGASVISFLADNEFVELKAKNLNTLDVITKTFHEKISSNSNLVQLFSQPLLEKLNETELTALRLLADGVPTKQLINHMDVGEKYAGEIIGRLCKKLNGINRDQLFFLLGRINLLQLS